MRVFHRFCTRPLPMLVVVLAATVCAISSNASPACTQQPPTRSTAEQEATSTKARGFFDAAVALQIEAEKGGPDAQLRQRRAAMLYRKALELRPQSPAALYNLGRAERALGDDANAAKHFELAAEVQGPKRVFYLQQWADFLLDTQQWNQAMDAYTDVVRLEPRLEEPHRILKDHYLGLQERSPHRLLDYLWTLVDARQPARAADLALTALESGWTSRFGEELLTVVAASLAQMPGTPGQILESDLVARLAGLQEESNLEEGIAELLTLYETPGSYTDPFPWWNVADNEWAEERGIPRRAAFRAVLRSIGDDYRQRNHAEIAAACYRAAIDLAGDPDPRALRTLATVYVEGNNLPALNALAIEYANPEGRIFAAKNEAYRLGQLETILDYH
ncbi:MAG: hypothetical protein K8J08_22580, partial [Thermoanaerobaculia bacterium]|nr:hypothetical protein [Thermoanaerobaculia bacterium]